MPNGVILTAAWGVLAVLWLPRAAWTWWHLRRDAQERRAQESDALRWADTTPVLMFRLLAPLSRRMIPHMWEPVCMVNGLLWPVEALTRRWRR